MKFPEGSGRFLRELGWLGNRIVRVDNPGPEMEEAAAGKAAAAAIK